MFLTRVPYINEILGKKSLRKIISVVIKNTGIARTAQFLDDIKNLGYSMAFKGGLSFNLGDVIIPEEKESLIENGYKTVESIKNNFSMGFITNNERYNKVIDLWTSIDNKITSIVEKQISNDQQGFNPVYMMLDSGARGSTQQIKQPLRHAWTYGEASEVRSPGCGDYREPYHIEPEGRHDSARILHLDARCA